MYALSAIISTSLKSSHSSHFAVVEKRIISNESSKRERESQSRRRITDDSVVSVFSILDCYPIKKERRERVSNSSFLTSKTERM